MIHDQLWKELLRAFFRELVEMFFPLVAARLDFSSVVFLDKELFTDVPKGLLREPDLVARVQTLDGQSELVLIHIEVQTRRQKEFGARMAEYFMLLRLRFRMPVFPVVIYLQRGAGGIGTDRYQESVLGVPVLSFDYQRIGVPDLNEAEQAKDNPLHYGLAALMKRGTKSKARHKAECLLGIARALVDEARRSLLINCVEAYLPLSEEEEQTFIRLTQKPELKEVTPMLNVYEIRGEARGLAQGEARGLAQGEAQGEARGALRAKRETALMLLSIKFGSLAPAVTERVQNIESEADLDQLLSGILQAPTLEELGLSSET